MLKEYSLIPLFEQFIKDSRKGKRLKADGSKIKSQTVDNYEYVLKLLSEFSITKNFELRIRPTGRLRKRQLKTEKVYWNKFYRAFIDFLYKDKNYFDNYAGSVIKNLRAFFGYLNRDKLIVTGDFYKAFHKKEEEIRIISFTPEQLQFLINNKLFEQALTKYQCYFKDIVVIGCTVALRFSDLFNIRIRDISTIGGIYYLSVRSVKTDIPTIVKLPPYVVDIIKRFEKGKRPSSKLFPSISMNKFNQDLRALTEKAGWTYEIGKHRSKNSEIKELFRDQSNQAYRFCDLVSSHILRKTAITTMLMLGMPENFVRKISGHAPNSKAFHRYVNYVQSYMDKEIDKVHEKLMEKAV